MIKRIVPITDLKRGEQGMVVELSGGLIFQRKLRVMGIREGKKVKIISIQPVGGPVTIEIGGCKITLGRGMAERIFVEVGK